MKEPLSRLGLEPLMATQQATTKAEVIVFWDHNKDFRTASGQWTTRRELSMMGHSGLIRVKYGKKSQHTINLVIYKGKAQKC